MEKGKEILSIAKETDLGQIAIEVTTESFKDVEKTIFIDSLGIIGDQKMGKSLLLNNLFGANFEVGSELDERTTEGINGQLLDKTDHPDEKIMVLDCEGAKSHQKEVKTKEALQKINQDQNEVRFTDEQIIDETKKLVIASDMRYTLFLWCSIDCLIYLIPDKPPTSTDIHFFINISNSAEIITKSQHKPSVILIYPKKEKDEKLEESYRRCLQKYAPTVSELCHLQFAPFRKFKNSEDEPKYQKSLETLRQLIFKTIKDNKSGAFSLQSWYETLFVIATNLNFQYELPDIRSLRAQLELRFIIGHYGKDLEKIANSLDLMLQKREEYDEAFSLSSYHEFLLNKYQWLENQAKQEKSGKINKTIWDINGLLSEVASLIFPPTILISILSAGFSIYVESSLNKEKDTLLNKYLKELKGTLNELENFKEIIDSYFDAFTTAQNTLVLHNYYVNIIEFFYGIARKILKQREQNPEPQEILQYMFKLFEDDNHREDLQHSKPSDIALDEKKIRSFNQLSFLHLKPAGQIVRAVSASYRYYSTLPPDILSVFKVCGIVFSGVLELIDIYKTWNRQDIKTLFDAFKRNEGDLESFAKDLYSFTSQNKKGLEEINKKANEMIESLSWKKEPENK